MSTLRVTYLKNQAAPNNTVTFDANNLVTVQGNVSIGSPLGSNGNLTVANNLTVSGTLTVGGSSVGAAAPGTILATTNTATPSGYLLCDGSAYLQSSYPSLAPVCNVATLAGTYLANLKSILGNQSAGGVNGEGTAGMTSTSDGAVYISINQAVSYNNYVSFDSGVTWASMRANVSTVYAKNNPKNVTIAYNGSTYVTANAGVSTGDNQKGVRYGSNIITSMSSSTITNVNKYVSGIVWTGTYFIAVGTPAGVSGATDANVASISTDGITWSLGGQLANTSSAITGHHGAAKLIAYGNNTLVAVVSNTVSSTNNFTTSLIRYSLDNATSWATATQPAGFGINNNSIGGSANNYDYITVSFANNQFIAVDSQGAVANSPNGVVWTLAAPAGTLTRISPTYGVMPMHRGYGSDAYPNKVGQGVLFSKGYYIIHNNYSTDLVTWKKFPQLGASRLGYSYPAGPGAVQPTTGNYFYSGTTYAADLGCGWQYITTDPGVISLYPNLGTQFNVPYLTDEQGGVVRYYIKT